MNMDSQGLRSLIKEEVKNYRLSQLDEGAWENLKHAVAKAGSLDNWFRSTKDKEAAEEYIQSLFDKTSNEFLKKLKEELDAEFEGFPNNKSEVDFAVAVASIYNAYDSLVNATKKQPDEEGYIPPDAANEMIGDLKDLVEYYSDKKLADVYKHFNEAAGEEEGEEEEDLRAKAKLGGREDYKTKTFKGLESNLLPGILGLLGGGFSAAHYAAMAAGLGDMPEAVMQSNDVKEIVNTAELQLGETVEVAASPGGLLKTLGQASGGGTAKTFGDFAAQIDQISDVSNAGAGDVVGGISQIMPNPEAGGKMMNFLYEYGQQNPSENIFNVINDTAPSEEFVQFVSQSDPGFAEQISGGAAGAGTFKGGLTNLLGLKAGVMKVAAQKALVITGKSVTKSLAGAGAVKMGAGTAIVGSGALGMIGIALSTAAAGVYLARLKGRKSSRAQKLQDLFAELKPVEGEVLEPEGEPEAAPGSPPTPEEIQGLVWDSYLLVTGQTDITGDPSGDLGAPPDKPPEKAKRLGLARMDDDGTKIYVATRRKQDLRDKERDLMVKAQDNAISGKTSSPSTDDLDKEFKKARRALNPKDASYKDIERAIQGKSTKEPEPYFTVDASVYNDSAKALKAAGVIKSARVTKALRAIIDKATKGLLGQFTKGDRKQSVKQTVIRIKNAFKRSNFELNPEAIQGLVKVFQTYGLTKEGEYTPAAPKETGTLQLEDLKKIIKQEIEKKKESLVESKKIDEEAIGRLAIRATQDKKLIYSVLDEVLREKLSKED